MLIRDLVGHEGIQVKGEFRTLQSQRISCCNGGECLRFGVRDISGNLRAHGWKERYQGPCSIEQDAKLLITGRMRNYEGHPILDVEKAEVVSGPERNPLVRMAHLPCPVVGAIEELYLATESLTVAPLRAFCFSAFSLPGLMEKFLIFPASSTYHHSHPGGLVQHSLECLASVQAQRGFSRAALELGMVAALFHDIGKIRTLRPDGQLTDEGYLVPHDDLTLEVLAPSLRELDSLWPAGGSDLRYIWSFLGIKGNRPRPRITVAVAVLAADQISAGLYNERSAFLGHPDWHRHARLDRSWYTRPARPCHH